MNDWLIVGALGMLFLIMIQLGKVLSLDSQFELNAQTTFNSYVHHKHS